MELLDIAFDKIGEDTWGCNKSCQFVGIHVVDESSQII